MKRILFLSAALLYADMVQAESAPMAYHPFAENPQAEITLSDYPPATPPTQKVDKLSQFYPTLYCGAVPKGRIVFDQENRTETAGKQINYRFDGETFKLEERYITIKNQKCTIKVLGLLEDNQHNQKTMMNLPVHGKFIELQKNNTDDSLKTVWYAISLSKLISERSDIPTCISENSTYNAGMTCMLKATDTLNKKGFIGYYFIPRIKNQFGCIQKTCPFSGFYYLDGKLGLLNETISNPRHPMP